MNYQRCLCTIVLVGSCAQALGQDVPPTETGTNQVTSRMVSGQLEIRDVRNGRAIIVPKTPLLTHFPASVTTTVELRSQPTGADIVITAHNTGSAASSLGHVHVGVLNLGQNIENLDFRALGGLPQACQWGSYVASAYAYPDDLYSPVFVVRNSDYAVGISMQYPVMDDKHDVMLALANPGGSAAGEGGPGWDAMFWLANPENHSEGRWATIQPGETRRYVVSVRVTRNPQEWQTTLLPYRDYFRSKYGGVKYQRETTPIRAVAMADASQLSASNPLGIWTTRPELNGWAPTITSIRNQFGDWPTIMLWGPTGLYLHHTERNYPYQFTSHWNATPQFAEATSPTVGLPTLVTPTRKLGLWWGYSCDVSTGWDTASDEPFDPDNPNHVRLALAEMDGAVRAGATVVGLDTFWHKITPVWKSYGWLQELERRYPSIKFCTEPSGCDILHTIAPTFVGGWGSFATRPASTDDLITIKGPNYLADFINPGHETWGQLSLQEMRRWFHIEPSRTLISDTVRNFASYGYRPVVCEPMTYSSQILAAQTWETTVPASIRNSDPYIADIRAGRLPGTRGSGPAGGGGATPPLPLTQNLSGGGSPTIPTFMRRSFASGSSSLQNSGQPRMSGRPSPPRMHMPRTRIEPAPRQGMIMHYVRTPDPQGSNPP